MTADELQAAGYRRYEPGPLKPHAADLYQRRVRAGDLTLYFVNVSRYAPGHGLSEGYEADAVLYFAERGPWLTVELHSAGEWSVEQVEAFFARAYAALGCVPDPHNQESP